MKKRFLKWLLCPSCGHGEFGLNDVQESHDCIESGVLICKSCQRLYPISKGIPKILPGPHHGKSDQRTARTKSSFGKEWELFANETYKDIAHIRHYVEAAWKDLSSFKGKIIVDAGCGPGYFSALFARHAKEVIALDLTEGGVAYTYAKIGHLPNVHVIQADLMHLPLKKEIAHCISSTGVLHHTPDPYHCFKSLVSILKPGGEIAISVYSKYPWPARFLYQTLRKITTRLSTNAVLNISRSLVLFTYLPTRFLQWVAYPWAARWPHASYKRRLWWTYDWYSPEYVNFYSKEEIRKWYENQGLEGFTYFPEIGGYYKGVKPT